PCVICRALIAYTTRKISAKSPAQRWRLRMVRYIALPGPPVHQCEDAATGRDRGHGPPMPWSTGEPEPGAGGGHQHQAPHGEFVVPGPRLHTPVARMESGGGHVQRRQVAIQRSARDLDTQVGIVRKGHPMAPVGVSKIEQEGVLL